MLIMRDNRNLFLQKSIGDPDAQLLNYIYIYMWDMGVCSLYSIPITSR